VGTPRKKSFCCTRRRSKKLREPRMYKPESKAIKKFTSTHFYAKKDFPKNFRRIPFVDKETEKN